MCNHKNILIAIWCSKAKFCYSECFIFQVIWKNLYSIRSARDSGTLYAARNLINARNVSADPSTDYYASAAMMDKFSKAYIIAGGLHHFGINSVADNPKENTYEGEIGNKAEMKQYILEQAKVFVTAFTSIDIPDLPDFGARSNEFKCRFCDRGFRGNKQLQKHEKNIHNHPELCNKLQQTSQDQEDGILSYTKLTLTLSLLRLNHNDAISYGDGKRIMLVNNFLLLLYKINNCPKYAFGILETVCQTKILLSERMAHRLIWNRTVNHRGLIDSNHPNDLDIEHCNKVFKDEAHSFRGIFTENTLNRVSRGSLRTQCIIQNFDNQTTTKKASGKHVSADTSQDVQLIVDQLIQQGVFEYIPMRNHNAFINISDSPFYAIDMENIREWLSNSLKKFSTKHFYD